MFRVLVVCTANICRSPAAAAILRRELRPLSVDGVVSVRSAGVRAWDGQEACSVTSGLLAPEVRDPGHRSRPVTATEVSDADLVLALDRSHRTELARLAPAARPRTFTVRQAAGLAHQVHGYIAADRLPPGAPPLPTAPVDRLRWWVAELDAARGSHDALPLVPPDLGWPADDIPDPHDPGPEIHEPVLRITEEAIVIASSGISAVTAVSPAPESPARHVD